MNPNPTTVRKGRERSCIQCGTTFRSIRSNARFCSASCRKKAGRGTAPTGGPKAGPENFSPITKALHLGGYIGPISPASSRIASPVVYGLLVPEALVFAELELLFDKKRWGAITRDDLSYSLRTDGILRFASRSREATDHKRWKDRQRQRMARSA